MAVSFIIYLTVKIAISVIRKCHSPHIIMEIQIHSILKHYLILQTENYNIRLSKCTGIFKERLNSWLNYDIKIKKLKLKLSLS